MQIAPSVFPTTPAPAADVSADFVATSSLENATPFATLLAENAAPQPSASPSTHLSAFGTQENSEDATLYDHLPDELLAELIALEIAAVQPQAHALAFGTENLSASDNKICGTPASPCTEENPVTGLHQTPSAKETFPTAQSFPNGLTKAGNPIAEENKGSALEKIVARREAHGSSKPPEPESSAEHPHPLPENNQHNSATPLAAQPVQPDRSEKSPHTHTAKLNLKSDSAFSTKTVATDANIERSTAKVGEVPPVTATDSNETAAPSGISESEPMEMLSENDRSRFPVKHRIQLGEKTVFKNGFEKETGIPIETENQNAARATSGETDLPAAPLGLQIKQAIFSVLRGKVPQPSKAEAATITTPPTLSQILTASPANKALTTEGTPLPSPNTNGLAAETTRTASAPVLNAVAENLTSERPPKSLETEKVKSPASSSQKRSPDFAQSVQPAQQPIAAVNAKALVAFPDIPSTGQPINPLSTTPTADSPQLTISESIDSSSATETDSAPSQATLPFSKKSLKPTAETSTATTEVFAAKAQPKLPTHAGTSESISKIKSLSTTNQQVTESDMARGIAHAVRLPTMNPTSATSALELHTESAALPTSSPSNLTSTTPQSTSQPEATRSLATTVVREIQAAIERNATAERSRVDIHLQSFDQESVRVQLQWRDGYVHATIRTDSADLQQALSREWDTFAPRASEKGMKLGTPTFETTQTASNNSGFTQQQSHHFDRNRDLDTYDLFSLGSGSLLARSRLIRGVASPATQLSTTAASNNTLDPRRLSAWA